MGNDEESCGLLILALAVCFIDYTIKKPQIGFFLFLRCSLILLQLFAVNKSLVINLQPSSASVC